MSANALKTGLNAEVYYFIVDYEAISTDKIQDIHRYLMKKKTKKTKQKKNKTISYKCGCNIFNIKCEFTKCNSIKMCFNEKSRV